MKIYLEKFHFVEILHVGESLAMINISLSKQNNGRDYSGITSPWWKISRKNSIRNHFFDEATCCWYYLPENFILLKICKFSFNLSQHSVTVRPFVCVYATRFTIKCYKIMLLSCCTLVANTPLLLLLLPLFYVVCYVTLSKKAWAITAKCQPKWAMSNRRRSWWGHAMCHYAWHHQQNFTSSVCCSRSRCCCYCHWCCQ